MEPGCGSASASGSGSEGGGGASNLLQDLPSRGYFTNVQPTSTGGLRAYVCEHDTTPPDTQCIKTDTTNILIRSLTLKNQQQKAQKPEENTKAKADGKGPSESSKGKRPATERPADEKPAAKKVNTGKKESSLKDKDLHSLTVEKLKAMLKEKGLTVRGKKDELIARLRKAS